MPQKKIARSAQQKFKAPAKREGARGPICARVGRLDEFAEGRKLAQPDKCVRARGTIQNRTFKNTFRLVVFDLSWRGRLCTGAAAKAGPVAISKADFGRHADGNYFGRLNLVRYARTVFYRREEPRGGRRSSR